VDSQHGLGTEERAIIEKLPAGITRITVHNKIDLSAEKPRCETGTEIWLSAKTGEGIDLLQVELLRVAGWQPAGEGGFMARRRHLDALGRAQSHLRMVLELSGQLELQAEELRLAQEALSDITGEFTPDDLLGEIFSRFCIGK
jgi:tRNA modification GTPase